jgi:hypothetical protein
MLNYPSFSRSEHCQDGFAIDESRIGTPKVLGCPSTSLRTVSKRSESNQ